MKRLIQKLIRGFGYDVRRLPDARDAVLYPYVEHFTLDQVRFKYWITDETYRDWYKPHAHAAWHETQGYLRLVAPRDRILEVGCNNGFTMCILKSITGPDALFVGMDVIPANCQIADSQVGLNSFRNCHILRLGGSDTNGTAKAFNTNNGFITTDDVRNVIDVQTIPPDDLIPTFGYFDILKIDVEGFEARVLKGSRALLTRMPKLIIELHGADVKRLGSSYEEVFSLIGVERYDGYACLRDENEIRNFDRDFLLQRQPHATVFLRPRTQS